MTFPSARRDCSTNTLRWGFWRVGVALMLLVSFSGAARAQTTPANDFSTTTSNGQVTITGYVGPGDITALMIPGTINSLPVIAIGTEVFSGITSLTSVTVPSGVTSIGEDAFGGCTSLTSVTLPSSVTNIAGAFQGCTSLASITIPNGVTTLAGTFQGCTSLNNVVIPNSVSTIDGAFSECTSLTSITIPSSVTTIGEAAFQGCTKLTTVTIPSGVTSIGEDAFAGCPFTSVTLPDSVTSIAGAFQNCTNLTSVTSVTTPNSLTIPKSVTSIAGAFYGCTGLTSVTIPNTVVDIDGAFANCTGLTSVTIPNSITRLGEYDQDGQNAGAFAGCTSLTNVTIPNSVTSIEGGFAGCTRLASVTIPNSVTTIGDGAFSSCPLTSVTIPNSVTTIGNDAFEGCPFASVTIPNGVTTTGLDAFSDCTNLTSVTIPNTFTSIGEGMFDECTSLASVTIPSGVTRIGEGAFAGCTSLTSVTIPNKVTIIGDAAFQGCTSLSSVMIPAGVTSFGTETFYGCTSLTSVTIPNSVATIESDTFEGCTSLTGVTIPASVTSIQYQAFAGCTDLSSAIFLGNAPTMGTGVFLNDAGNFAVSYQTGATGFTTPTWTDSSGDTYDTVDAGAEATVTLSGLTAAYNGSPHGVTVTTKPTGLATSVTYNGSATVPTNAGSYAVVATITASGYTGQATGTFTITGTPATVALTASTLKATYNGSPHAVTATTTPSGLSVSFTYDGSSTAPTAVGSYAVVATITSPNYSGSGTGTLEIGKGTATVTLSNLAATYDGDGHGATAVTDPSGLTTTLTYAGKATEPVNVGSYAVVATVTDPNYMGSGTGTLVIAKGAATVTLTPASLMATYTGKAVAAAATTVPAGLPVTFAYTQNGKSASPVNAGSYDVTATVNTANAAGSASGTLVISPEPLTLTFGPLTVPYTGKPIAATGTTSPVKEPLTFTYTGTTGSTTPPTALGSYPVAAHLSSANFTFANASTGTLTIVNPPVIATSPATPLLSAFGAQVSFGVTPNGIATRAYYEFATNSAFNLASTIATETVGSGATPVMVTGFLTGLAPDTLYYYRIVVLTSVGVEYGPTETFTTLGFETTQVAATGDFAVGSSGPTFASFGNPAVNESDEAAFAATLNSGTATGITSANDFGIWTDDAGTRQLVAQIGTVAPGTTNATFLTLGDPVFNNGGAVAFYGTLKAVAGQATSTTATGIWSTASGPLGLVARQGGNAPAAGTFDTFTSLGLSESAGAVFYATLNPNTSEHITSANDAGIFEGKLAAGLTQLLQLGQEVGGKTITALSFLPKETCVNGQTRSFNSSTGDIVAGTTFSDKSTGVVTVIGGTPALAYVSGGTATGVSGGTFASFGSPAINTSNDLAFAATLAGVASGATASIWADNSGGTLGLIAESGTTPAPGTTAAFVSFSDPVYNNNEAVAFRGTLKIATGQATSSTATGIWCNSTGPLALVAQQGGPAPGCGGATFDAFNELALADQGGATNKGGAIFLATLNASITAGVTATDNLGIWAVDNSGTLQLIVRTGDVLNGKTVTGLAFLPAETIVNGQSRSFAQGDGDLVYLATFSDKSEAIFNVVFP